MAYPPPPPSLRSQAAIGPCSFTHRQSSGSHPPLFHPLPADLSAPCRHDDSIPSSPTVLPASPSGGFHRQCVWFHHLSYPFPRVIRWARSLRERRDIRSKQKG